MVAYGSQFRYASSFLLLSYSELGIRNRFKQNTGLKTKVSHTDVKLSRTAFDFVFYQNK